jgi:hypothetical protein
MKINFSKINGQGNLTSKLDSRIFENNSIVSRLQSRTLTGRGLDIEVHQHLGYRLHFVWENKQKKDVRAMLTKDDCHAK